MERTRTGKRTVQVTAQLVEDDDKIEMWVRTMPRNPIVFRADTGASGSKAYGKLKQLFDAEAEESSVADAAGE